MGPKPQVARNQAQQHPGRAFFSLTTTSYAFMVLLNVVTLKSYYTGPLAEKLNSVDISWIVGAVVTAIVYLAMTRNLNTSAEASAIKESEEQLHQEAGA